MLVTRTLIIAGEPRVTTTSTGQRGAMLRVYDKADGNEVGAVYMPAPQSGSPMTYMFNGKQYIVVAVSGGNYSGELFAFRLPAKKNVNARSQSSQTRLRSAALQGCLEHVGRVVWNRRGVDE